MWGGGGGCQAAPRGGALAYAHSGNAFDNSCRKKDRNVRSISRKWLDLRQRQGEVGGGGSGGAGGETSGCWTQKDRYRNRSID